MYMSTFLLMLFGILASLVWTSVFVHEEERAGGHERGCICPRETLVSVLGLFWVVMGWLRSVGSIKLQVSFAEYSLF